jgi:hypothetical protein
MTNLGGPQPPPATPGDLAIALTSTPSPDSSTTAGAASLTLASGVVQSIQPGPPRTLTVTILGNPTPAAGVVYAPTYSPRTGDTVYMLVNGTDYTVLYGPPGAPPPAQVGEYKAFGGAVSDPAWLLADGSSFNGTTYWELAAFLGGTTLPDARGVAIMGAGVNGIVLGTRSALGSQPAHTHTSAAHLHGSGGPHTHTTEGFQNSNLTAGASGVNVVGGSATSGSTDPGNTASTTPGATGSTGSGTANVPPNLGANVYIRAY